MAATSKRFSAPVATGGAQRLCRIVGFACLIGFLIDFLVIVFPPAIGTPSWRLGTLQQVGDRSIILLFGFALLMYAAERRKLVRSLAFSCFALGAVLLISCAIVAQDSLTVQRQATEQISAQASQLGSRIQTLKESNPAAKVAPEQLQRATQRLNLQADAAKQNANNSILKSGFLSVGNLAVVGIALLIVGRYGLYLMR